LKILACKTALFLSKPHIAQEKLVLGQKSEQGIFRHVSGNLIRWSAIRQGIFQEFCLPGSYGTKGVLARENPNRSRCSTFAATPFSLGLDRQADQVARRFPRKWDTSAWLGNILFSLHNGARLAVRELDLPVKEPRAVNAADNPPTLVSGDEAQSRAF